MKEDEQWLQRWNERYRNPEYAYGTAPNHFVKSELQKYSPGKILFAAEGEGRNAVYAATEGWQTHAFDISEEGRQKAELLAKQAGVVIDYRVGELPNLGFEANTFDMLVLIFAHFPASLKSAYHKKLSQLLKPGGQLIFQAFSKKHLPLRKANPKVGGPDNIADLFAMEELQEDFADFHFLSVEEKVIELNEGIYHQGTGCVIQFIAQKNTNE